jgi:hypothetical protein
MRAMTVRVDQRILLTRDDRFVCNENRSLSPSEDRPAPLARCGSSVRMAFHVRATPNGGARCQPRATASRCGG